MSATASPATPEKPTRQRRERRRRKDIPRAPSFEATRPLGECYPRLFMSGWRAKLSDLVRKNVKNLRGAAETPIGWEGIALLLQVYIGKLFGSKYGAAWILMSGTPQDDRRLRPEGLSVLELVDLTNMNYYRPGDRLAALKRSAWVIARQPRKMVEKDDRRWEGLANQIEIPWRTIEALGMTRAEVEVELEKEEADRLAAKKAQAQLEGQQLAADQQDARNRRGENYPLIQPKAPHRKAAVNVLDLDRDATGRRIPHTQQERVRFMTIKMAMSQSPEWADRHREHLHGAALERWREELEPPT